MNSAVRSILPQMQRITDVKNKELLGLHGVL